MKKTRTAAALLLTLGLCLTAALAAGGDAALLSLSHLQGAFSQSLDVSLEGRLEAMEKEVQAAAQARLDAMGDNLLASSGQSFAPQPREAALKTGDVLTGSTGLSVIPLAGEVRLTITSGAVVDVTEGREVSSGQTLSLRHRYLAAEDALASFTVVSPTAVVSYEGSYALSPSCGDPDYFAIARALRDLGLFRGTGSSIGEGFDLHLVPNRGQGLVMFLRLLGEEDSALGCTYAHPFTDVPPWLDRYAAWAYQWGYTNGVAPTLFGTEQPLSAPEYQEFLLRALGYSVAGVHDYATALERALDCGALTSREYEALRAEPFLRAHVAYMSFYSLEMPLSGSRQTLAQRLEAAGVLTGDQLAGAQVNSPRLR